MKNFIVLTLIAISSATVSAKTVNHGHIDKVVGGKVENYGTIDQVDDSVVYNNGGTIGHVEDSIIISEGPSLNLQTLGSGIEFCPSSAACDLVDSSSCTYREVGGIYDRLSYIAEQSRQSCYSTGKAQGFQCAYSSDSTGSYITSYYLKSCNGFKRAE